MSSNIKIILAVFFVFGIILFITPFTTASYEVVITGSDAPYTLGNNIPDNTENSSGIYINANNIILDCSGYNITGIGNANSYGIYVDNSTNVTIQNCYISDMDKGIYYNDVNDSIITNTVLANMLNDSIHINGRNDTIKDSEITDNTSSAIGINIDSANGYHQIYNNTISMDGTDSIAINFNSTLDGYNNITANGISANGICINNIQGTGNIVLENVFYGLKWIDNQGDTIFNTSTEGNVYYFVNGSGSWTTYDIHDLNGDGWADYGTSRPFDATILNDTYWTGFGEDWNPGIYDEYNPSIYFESNTDNKPFVNRNNIFINVSASDVNLVNLTISVYNSTSGLINYTETNQSNIYINVTDLFDGLYYFNATAYDSLNHTNSTATRNITIDTTPPYFTYIPENTAINYREDWAGVDFNATDNIGFGSYSINDTAHFTINSTGYLNDKPTLAIGTYTINITINDTTGNSNSTIYQVTVNQNTENCAVFFNATSPITYPESFTVYTNCTSDYTLYRNGVNISNASIQSLGAGDYNFTVIRKDNENYSNIADTELFTVNKATPTGSISGTTTITYGTTGDIEGTETNQGDSDVVYTLYRNGTLVSNPDNSILAIGTYNYIYNSTGGENYTSNSEIKTFNLTVSKNTENCTIYFNETSPLVYPATFKIYTNCTSSYILYRNGINISNESTQSLAAGIWNFEVQRTDEVNYSNTYDEKAFTVNKATPTGSISGTTTITYGTIGDIEGTETNTGDTDVIYTLYRNGIPVSNPDNTILAAGTYNYTYNTTGGENYTTNKSMDIKTLTVNKNNLECKIYFNTTSPITYPATFKVYTNCTSEFTIYRNGTIITNNSEQTLSAGTYNFTVIRTDNENYSNTYDEKTFTITEAPYFTLIPPNATINYGEDWIGAQFNATDETALDQYSINDTAHFTINQSGYLNDIPTLAIGTYLINITINDTTGNTNSIIYMLTVQNITTPTIEFNYPTDNETTIGRSYILINLTTTGNNVTNITINIYNSSYDLINQETYYAAEAYINYTVPIDGTYHFNATAYNVIGQRNSTQTRNITIDTTNPSISFNPSTDTGIIERRYFIINISIFDLNIKNSTLRIYNSTGSQINTTTSIANEIFLNQTNLSDGIYYYNATTYDLAGNSNTTDTQNITIDTLKPSIIFNTGTDNNTIGRNYISANVSASDANLKNITIILYNSTGGIINSASTQSNNISVDFTSLPDGIYHLNATAYDLAGNVNYTATRNITIDTSDPNITIITPVSQIYTYSNISLSINVSSTKSISSCHYTIDGVDYAMTNCSSAMLDITDGIKLLYIYANDTFGISGYSMARFIVDTLNSTIKASSVSIEVNNTNSTNITILFISSNSVTTQVSINHNISDNTNITLYFANVTNNDSQSNITINTGMNITRNSTGLYALELPSNLTITGPNNWTGEVLIPTITTDTVNIIPGSGMSSATASKVIVLGYSQRLSLSHAARIIIGGEAGKNAGYDEGAGTVTRITNTCPSATNQTQVDEYFNANNITECVINSDSGTDLIIWTKHFSRYATFTEIATVATVPASSASSSSSGGGGSSAYTPNNTTNASDAVVVSKYFTNLNHGIKNITIDENGMPITYLTISIVNDSNTSSTLKITAQSYNPSNAKINATIYKYIIFNSSINPAYINDITYKFKIDKKWLAQNNLTSANVTIYEYNNNNNTWIEHKENLSKYSEDTGYIYYSSSILKFKNVAVGGSIIQSIPAKIVPVQNTGSGNTEYNGNDSVATNEHEPATLHSRSFNWSGVLTKTSGALAVASKSIIGAITLIKNKIYYGIAGLNISKDMQILIVITISSILLLIVGVVSGVLVYKNTIKPKLEKKKKSDEVIIKIKNTKAAKIGRDELLSYKEEAAQETIKPSSFNTDASGRVVGITPPEHPEMYVRKIYELLTQCEYALSNGDASSATDYYNEARAIYFGSGLNYEQKEVVYVKMMELHEKLSKMQS